MKRITDRDFVYVSSDKTDIRKTFERIRAEQEALKQQEKEAAAWRLKNVISAKKGCK